MLEAAWKPSHWAVGGGKGGAFAGTLPVLDAPQVVDPRKVHHGQIVSIPLPCPANRPPGSTQRGGKDIVDDVCYVGRLTFCVLRGARCALAAYLNLHVVQSVIYG